MKKTATYSFVSADGVRHKGFSRERLLLWYYDGKIKKGAPVTKTENGAESIVTIDILEPEPGKGTPNDSGLRTASRPKGTCAFNLGALMLAPFWTLFCRNLPMAAAMWICMLVIGFVAWASSFAMRPFGMDLMSLFRLDAASHILLLALSVYTGFTGPADAWRAFRFESVGSFKKSMLRWQIAGVFILLLYLAAFALFAVAAVRHNLPGLFAG